MTTDMTTHRNPFRFGSPVTASQFCNRTSELARVRASIRSPNSLWLYAPRRYGKTSLIKEAFRTSGEEVATAFVDIYGVTDAHGFVAAWLAAVAPLLDELAGGVTRALQHVKSVFSAVTPQLSLSSDGTPVFSLANRLPAAHTEATVAEALRAVELAARRAERRVVIAWDEFQEIAAIPGLEAAIRREVQHHQQTSFIFSGSRHHLLQAMFTERQRPFFEFGEHMTLTRLPPAELHAYIRARFERTGRAVPDEVVADLVATSAGHPHYAQYFSATAWELQPQVSALDQLPEAWRERVVAGLDPAFRMVFDRLSASQRKVVRVIAQRGGSGLHSEAVRQEFGLGSSSTVAGALDALVLRDVLEPRRGATAGYAFVNPSFALWLRRESGGARYS